MIGPYFEAWTKVQPYTSSLVSLCLWYTETSLVAASGRGVKYPG